ncbi:Cell division protein FtsK [Planctomycetales bacterium 10988]|nr:Cell division protein FtsK [Planctomycetales bacterium 10988]
MKRQHIGAGTVLLLLGVGICSVGCNPTKEYYLCDPQKLQHFKQVATKIEYPDINTARLPDAEHSLEPFSLENMASQEIWDLSLQEAIEISLRNSKVMRDIGGQVLTSPSSTSTVYEPAIQESDPRFGVEAALSAFDANLSSSLTWQKNDRPVNQVFTGLNQPVFEQDQADFTTQIDKTTATGTQFFARNNTDYEWNNNPSNAFPSAWQTNFELGFQHPLLQGGGIAFNRIAGPNAEPGFFFSNGVMIARLNNDIALTDFEASVRRLVSDVENAYWDLYFAYRDLDARVAGRDSALETWRKIYALYEQGAKGGEADKEAQAREQYFLFRAQVEDALSGSPGGSTQSGSGTRPGVFRGAGGVYAREANLRLLLGIAATDGRLIRTTDEPTTAEVHFDWDAILHEAFCRRVELRRQRWLVKRRELELVAAKNFLKPRLDALGTYRWRGFGDDLINPERQPGQFDNAFQTLTGGDFQEWNLGLQFSMPIGHRQAMAAVRNAKLGIARDRAVLQEQELQITHDISGAIRELHRAYRLSETNFNRRVAAQRQVEAVSEAYKVNTVTLDVLLDAQRRLADAESAYYRSLVEYTLAIKAVQFEKGSLLEYNGVYLAEGPWPCKAYSDARKLAMRRKAATRINYGFTCPPRVSEGTYRQDAGHVSMLAPGMLRELPSSSGEPTLAEPPVPAEAPEGETPPRPEAQPEEERFPLPSPADNEFDDEDEVPAPPRVPRSTASRTSTQDRARKPVVRPSASDNVAQRIPTSPEPSRLTVVSMEVEALTPPSTSTAKTAPQEPPMPESKWTAIRQVEYEAPVQSFQPVRTQDESIPLRLESDKNGWKAVK